MGVEVGELPLNKDGVPVKDEPGKPVVRRRGLVARKDFAAGEVIYKVPFTDIIYESHVH